MPLVEFALSGTPWVTWVRRYLVLYKYFSSFRFCLFQGFQNWLVQWQNLVSYESLVRSLKTHRPVTFVTGRDLATFSQEFIVL
jgi:hypothetical protein